MWRYDRDVTAQIPVFVSAPTDLNDDQQSSYDLILELLKYENFERRALGRSDYPNEFPLKEIHHLARHCSGGIILGYTQMTASRVLVKPGTAKEKSVKGLSLPTPWNQLKAGILFSMGLPLMVFRQEGIQGGVFDNGVTDVFVQRLPVGVISSEDQDQIKASMQFWAAKVREHYRKWPY